MPSVCEQSTSTGCLHAESQPGIEAGIRGGGVIGRSQQHTARRYCSRRQSDKPCVIVFHAEAAGARRGEGRWVDDDDVEGLLATSEATKPVDGVAVDEVCLLRVQPVQLIVTFAPRQVIAG